MTGTLLYAHALRHSPVAPVTAVLWAVEVIGPSIVGVAVLGDTVRAGWAPWAAIAVLATVAATTVLVTAPGPAEHRGAVTGRPAGASAGRAPST